MTLRASAIRELFGLFARCLIVGSIWTASAQAAQISLHEGDDGLDVIFIEGEIRSGDEGHFRRLALSSDNAVIILAGPGGALVPALEIGKAIQVKGFATYVPDETQCTSACALIWVAGSPRYMASTANVGFHASYLDNNGQPQETGLGNAIVGRYLTLLNLPEKAVIFATAASPDQFMWLTSANAVDVGIPFEGFDLQLDAPDTEPYAEAQAQPPPAPAWYFASETSGGSLVYVRGADVQNGRAHTRAARMWIHTDNSKDASVDWTTARILYAVDCVAETSVMEAMTTYDRSGRAETTDGDGLVSHIVPGSVMSAAAGLVCSDTVRPPNQWDLWE